MYKLIIFVLFLIVPNISSATSTVDKNLLNEMLNTVNQRYLYDIDLSQIINNGLQGLNEIDDKITIFKGKDCFYIYYNNTISNIVKFPQDINSIAAWVDTLEKVLQTVTKISEKAAVKDFELPDVIMKKIAAGLDDYSKYYSEYEYDEDEEQNQIYTLFSDRMLDNNVLYMRIRIFNKQTAKFVKKSLLSHQNIKGVILDLRGNSGGMLNEALKVAGLFCDGEIITYTAERNNDNIHYYTSPDNLLFDGPLTIITDGDTASAAEVLAGGFKDQSRATLIGTRTFGKGTIQKIIRMSNGGKLVLTAEQFFTPSGNIIHKQGILPDICLTDTDENDDCIRESRLRKEEDIEEALKVINNQL